MEEINKYTIDVIKKKTNEEFTGRYVNRKLMREEIEEENINPMNQDFEDDTQTLKKQELKGYGFKNTETEREMKIRIFKLNSSKILHERNKYVFLASVAERAISLGEKLSDVLGFVLIKKLFKMLCYLRYMLQNKVISVNSTSSMSSNLAFGKNTLKLEISIKSQIISEKNLTFSKLIIKTWIKMSTNNLMRTLKKVL